MNKKIIKIIAVILSLLFFLGGIFVYSRSRLSDGKLHLVFCNVGQGDAILVRTPKGIDVLVDSGPDNKILACLEKHLPFWDKTIELAILSHPHADHLTGFITLSKYYKIQTFITEKLRNTTVGYDALMQVLALQKIKIQEVFAQDKFKIKDGVVLQIVGPSQGFMLRTSPTGVIGESGEFASLETLLIYQDFSALLTGDSQVSELEEAIGDRQQAISNLSALQVPHHGSKFGLSKEIIDVLNPQLAVISVGKNNKYGHPAAFTLEILRNKDIKVLRTDERGDVEIVSDGKEWKVR